MDINVTRFIEEDDPTSANVIIGIDPFAFYADFMECDSVSCPHCKISLDGWPGYSKQYEYKIICPNCNNWIGKKHPPCMN